MKLEPGICLAIEPMLTLGSDEVAIQPDGWTVVTADGSLAAHFEHTIAVTDHGPEILTDASDERAPTAAIRSGRLPGLGIFDTLRVRVSARPGRHSS